MALYVLSGNQAGEPDVPIYKTEVNVPAGARMVVGRIGSQPNFGLMRKSGFQYQLISDIPKTGFTNTRLLLNNGLKIQPNKFRDYYNEIKKQSDY